MKRACLCCCLLFVTTLARAQSCGDGPIQLQLLGSGDVPLTANRAGAGTLLWLNGKGRALIDIGPGVGSRLLQSETNGADLDVLLFTQLRSERSADLPVLVQTLATARTRALPIYGPADSRWMPSTVSFVRSLFDPTRGAWRHLGDSLNPLTRSFKLEPHDVKLLSARLGRVNDKNAAVTVFTGERLQAAAWPMLVGQTPTLVWVLNAADKRIVISAAFPDAASLAPFIKDVDVLVLPLSSERAEPNATAIAHMAQTAGVKQLVLAPHAQWNAEQTEQLLAAMQRHYSRTIVLANDLECVTP